ncbi:hypothetical protein [Streptomyces sp. TRM75563]|uniref:hypothetical protein n=1 Tax=Streptomyces sp. TRM75563 TaxID=2817418 RepID=UPI001F6259B8|nr:hypothetical protein [Streptomyces sp. TRM75563]MCI4040108.1 hypothetical protein [Streptomyces sp. TRM75563]
MVNRWGEDEAVRDERLPLEYAVLPAQRRLWRWIAGGWLATYVLAALYMGAGSGAALPLWVAALVCLPVVAAAVHSWRKSAGGTRIDEDGVTTGVWPTRQLCRWEEIRAVTTVRTGSGPSARTFIQLVRQDSRAVTLQAPVDLAEDPDHRFRRAHAIVRDAWEERSGGGAA